jgi:hypothetical protein
MEKKLEDYPESDVILAKKILSLYNEGKTTNNKKYFFLDCIKKVLLEKEIINQSTQQAELNILNKFYTTLCHCIQPPKSKKKVSSDTVHFSKREIEDAKKREEKLIASLCEKDNELAHYYYELYQFG